MCGRYTFFDVSKLTTRYGVGEVSFDGSYTISPGSMVPVIFGAQPKAALMRWGLVPHWAKDPKKYQFINARVETAKEKPAFRDAFSNYRCLVPANGFYEWLTMEDGKQPYYFHQDEGEVVSFAGIYSAINDVEGRPLSTFGILTKPANEVVEPIHERMPVILNTTNEKRWLGEGTKEELTALALNSEVKLVSYPVSRDVNRAVSDVKELIEPISL